MTALGPQWQVPGGQPGYGDFVRNGPQFGEGLYHGTHREIEGGEIRPANQTKHRTNFDGMSNASVAYATENEATAWEISGTGQRMIHDLRGKGTVPGRLRVHEVEPHPQMTVGRYHPDSPHFIAGGGGGQMENLSEWVAPKFKTKGTIDIQPGQQGTFPLNWNQFRKNPTAAPGWNDEYNHPSDETIEQGHEGGALHKESLKRVYGDPEEERRKRGHPGLDRLLQGELF